MSDIPNHMKIGAKTEQFRPYLQSKEVKLMLANIWTHMCNMKRIFAFICRRPNVQYIKQYGISFEEIGVQKI